jgi:hypothetical protein
VNDVIRRLRERADRSEPRRAGQCADVLPLQRPGRERFGCLAVAGAWGPARIALVCAWLRVPVMPVGALELGRPAWYRRRRGG